MSSEISFENEAVTRSIMVKRRYGCIPLGFILLIALCAVCGVITFFEFVPMPIDSQTEANIRTVMEQYRAAIVDGNWELLRSVTTEREYQFWTREKIPETAGIIGINCVIVDEHTPRYAVVDVEYLYEGESPSSCNPPQTGAYFLLWGAEGWKVDDTLWEKGYRVPPEYSQSSFKLFRWILGLLGNG